MGTYLTIKMPNQEVSFNLPAEKIDDFQDFLSSHQEVFSFSNTNNIFSVQLNSMKKEEQEAFINQIINNFSVKLACQAKCRDGTNCLNKAKENGYCRVHDK